MFMLDYKNLGQDKLIEVQTNYLEVLHELVFGV